MPDSDIILVAVIAVSLGMAQIVTTPQKMIMATRLYLLVAATGMTVLAGHIMLAAVHAFGLP